jgi:hypothetical protein
MRDTWKAVPSKPDGRRGGLTTTLARGLSRRRFVQGGRRCGRWLGVADRVGGPSIGLPDMAPSDCVEHTTSHRPMRAVDIGRHSECGPTLRFVRQAGGSRLGSGSDPDNKKTASWASLATVNSLSISGGRAYIGWWRPRSD